MGFVHWWDGVEVPKRKETPVKIYLEFAGVGSCNSAGTLANGRNQTVYLSVPLTDRLKEAGGRIRVSPRRSIHKPALQSQLDPER
jgi:hypothetical protein